MPSPTEEAILIEETRRAISAYLQTEAGIAVIKRALVGRVA